MESRGTHGRRRLGGSEPPCADSNAAMGKAEQDGARLDRLRAGSEGGWAVRTCGGFGIKKGPEKDSEAKEESSEASSTDMTAIVSRMLRLRAWSGESRSPNVV